MASNNNPYDQKLLKMLAQQQALMNAPRLSSIGIPINQMARRSNIDRGDRVVLISGEGDDKYPESNPHWGRDGEFIAGIVENIDSFGGDMVITWDHGRRNMYRYGRCEIRLLEDAPSKKKIFKNVEFDTTKLDALIIDLEIKNEIVAVLQQHKHSKKIFDEWGLGEVIEYGRGMTILFWGGPGTGKTFGARCIAKSLGKDLLVIGAAEIQTSEPGGANRNIQNAFRTAKTENKVLFIDECDSLIANRANLGMILASEINTLLTEIEKSETVVILATNRIEDMDTALERRLSLIVEFPMPKHEQRIAIWKGLIPKKMPVAKDVVIEDLAKYEITGGLIKNVVLQSARLAVMDDAKEVSKKHFDTAMKRVISSQGLMGKGRIQSRNDMTVGTSTDLTVSRKLNSFLKKEDD